jgi:hypothetical protein
MGQGYVRFHLGANASMDKAKAARMKRLYGDALMVLEMGLSVQQRCAHRGGAVAGREVFAFFSCVMESFASSVG